MASNKRIGQSGEAKGAGNFDTEEEIWRIEVLMVCLEEEGRMSKGGLYALTQVPKGLWKKKIDFGP